LHSLLSRQARTPSASDGSGSTQGVGRISLRRFVLIAPAGHVTQTIACSVWKPECFVFIPPGFVFAQLPRGPPLLEMKHLLIEGSLVRKAL
jgi:hypothetical protein